jgi:cathepsin B
MVVIRTQALCLALLVGFSNALHPVRQEIVDRVNNDKSLRWRAVEVEDNMFANRSIDEIKGMLGLKDYGKMSPHNRGTQVNVGDIPDSFDARDKFSSCQFSIMNQASCGSCWAFGAAETLSTNLCVLGMNNEALSPQDLVSCDKTNHACHGGTLPAAWDYIQANGLVSDSSDPYTSGDGSCNNTCVPSCPSRDSPKKCPVQYSNLNSDQEIQAAVMFAGAVEVGFFVMADFLNYKGGIFHSTSKQTLGGHAVKIVGWGREGTQFYWIVQNSWGPAWGEDGFFRIDNWKEDNESSIAIGGGWACVQGATPAPPSPPPSPSSCDDIVSYCKQYDTHAKCQAKSYVIPVCKKTCGCCDEDPPAYCNSSVVELADVIV